MRKLHLSKVKPGMTLAKAIYGPDGQLWLNAGVCLKEKYIASLKSAGVASIFIEDPFMRGVVAENVVADETRIKAVTTVKKTLQDMKTGILQNGRVVDNRFLFTVEKLIGEVLANKDVMFNLDDIRTTDDYTFAHSVNVSILAILIGTHLRFTRSRLEELAVGALLHDVGKTWIDDAILKKPGSLTPEEFKQIKRHPMYGFDILSHQSNISHNSIRVVAQHHERCDGSGYPYQLTRDDIHEYARLVMIIDVFDALTADRPYRDALKPHQAMEIITGSSEYYDPEIIRTFIAHVAAFPVGTALRLSSGEIGFVIKNNYCMPLRPVIRICKDNEGRFYNEPYDVDMLEKLDLVVSDVLDDQEQYKELPLYQNSVS